MKKMKYITALFMIMSSFVGLFVGLQPVNAQENAVTSVTVDAQVYLAMYGGEPTEQTQISYDIIQTDPDTGEGTLVYSYRSNEPNTEPLMLTPGNYKFRLYDAGNFQRDGQELIPARVEQTHPTTTDQDVLKELSQTGDLIPWGDGTVVLDVPFEIELGDNLLNEATNQYEAELVVTIADQQSIATLPENPDEPDTPGEEVPEETGILMVQVIGSDGSLVANTVLSVNGEEFTTNAQGLLQVDNVPAGEVQVEVLSVPEDYSIEGITMPAEPITVVSQEMTNVKISVERIPETPEANTVTLTVLDEESVPVSNVSMTLNEREIYTDVNGQAVFSEVPVGEATYTINSVPEGYSLEQTTGTVVVDPTTPTEATITLSADVNTNNIEFVVTNEAFGPINGVEIQIADSVYTTTETGRVETEALPVGGYSYDVISAPEGFEIPVTGSVNVVESAPTEEAIALPTSVAYGSLLVNVVDDVQQPINGAELTLGEQTAITDGSGQVVFEDLEANQSYEYSVTALPEGYVLDGEAEVRTITINPDQQVEDTLVIAQAEQVDSAVFTVVDEASQPVENVEIQLGNETATTNPSGVAEFTDIGPGTYNYTVTNLPEQYETPAEGQLAIVANEEATQEINLSEVEQFGKVTFSVVDQNNEPVDGAKITLNNNTYPSNSNGQVIIEGLNADQTYNYTLASLPENYTGQVSGTVIIEANNHIEETVTVERELAPGQLTITVMDQSDQAVSGAQVQLNEDQTETTNAEGQVVFDELVEGTYEYIINELPENYEHNIASQSVYIAEGATEARTLQVQHNVQPGTVIFNVTDQDNSPVEGAVISINDTTITTNTEGTATIADIEPNTYTYSITELPEGYIGNASGEVTVNESEITTAAISVEREIELSTADIKVVDQNGDAVEGASLAFGGLTGTTNAEGIAHFESLEPGRYNYSVTSTPDGYYNNSEEQATEIEEGSAFEAEIRIEKLTETGSVTIQIRDNNNQPVAGVEIRIDHETYTTDNNGEVTVDNLEVGSYPYEIINVPEGFEIEELTGEFGIVANETITVSPRATAQESSSSEESSSQESSSESTSSQESSSESSSQSQSSSVIVDESQSLTPAEQASIDEEASQATRQFIDAETGIEVWVNPQDAMKVSNIHVETLDSAATLENADADIYTITLLDENNEAVQLTRIAEIKIPTRPVNSQLRVVRVNDSNNSNLTFALHNQRITFRTQQLGTFGIVYNAEQASISQEESVEVTVESSVEENDDDLPNTGETSTKGILFLGVLVLLSGAYLVFTRNKSTNKH